MGKTAFWNGNRKGRRENIGVDFWFLKVLSSEMNPAEIRLIR
jgi:tRNA U34 5-methylaminomethyl-2-thiouridine-forming methyltransferase MnmC